jgi:hypothetical protein
MEIAGKVISLLPLQKGTGKNGEWKKQDFILETQSQFSKKVCISLWGPKIDQYKLKSGDMISAKIEVESREFNGKWYTDIKAYQISTSNGSAPAEDYSYNQDIGETFEEKSNDVDDLPF